jgi:hypothetical protein
MQRDNAFLAITRGMVISLSLILLWTVAFMQCTCFGLDAAEEARASSTELTITTYGTNGEGHLIKFPDSTTMSIDCASGNITTKSHFHSDHCAECGSGQYNRNNVSPGQVIYNKDGVTVTVVAANGRIIGEESVNVPCHSSDENPLSMALLIKYKGFDYLTGGDLYGSVEGPLGSALKARGIHVDVLKVSHHGTDTNETSSLSYLEDILPEYAVICGTATSPTTTTLRNLVSAGVKTIYYAYNYSDTVPQVYKANGTIVISTNGRTYSFSGGNPSFYHGPYDVDEYVPCKAAPPHLLITEVALDPHLAPENHDWVELYLPSDASPVNLNELYWTDLDEVQRAATGTVTLMPNDAVILHDAPGASESNATGKKGNGVWDIYVENPLSGTWNTYDDQFVICSQRSTYPSPETIIDAVAWSNFDGEMRSEQVDDGNYLIQECQWGDPEAGDGFFSATGEGPAAGNIRDGYLQRITTIDTNSKGDWQISQAYSQGIPPPTPTPLPPQPPLPTQPPAIQVILSSTNPSEGDTFSVGLIVQPIPERPFDGYAVITGKAGTFSIQRGNRLSSGIAPFVTNIPALPIGFSGALMNMAIPQGVSGDYQVHVGLLDAGAKVKGPSSTFAYGVATLTVR